MSPDVEAATCPTRTDRECINSHRPESHKQDAKGPSLFEPEEDERFARRPARVTSATIEVDASGSIGGSSKSSADPLDPEGQRAPDGGYGWVVVLASFLCNFTVDGICYTTGLFLPYFMQQFGAGKAMAALAGSAMSGYYIAGLFVSGLVNRFGCRPVTIAGSLVATLALVAASFAPNIYLLIATYGLLTGIFFGFIYLPSIVSVGFYFTSRRAQATAIAVCGSGTGAFAMAPFVSWLLERFGWAVTIRVLAGLVLAVSIYGMLMKPLGPNKSKKEAKNKKIVENADPQVGEECRKANSITAIFDISVLKEPIMALLSVANIFGMIGYYIPFVYIAGYAEESVYVGEFKATANESALVLSAIGISNVCGRLVFGVVADKFNGKRICGSSARISPLLIQSSCLVVTALTTTAIPFCTNYWVLLVNCSFFGFFISTYMSLPSIIMVDLLGIERLSTTFGWINFFRGLSAIFGPPIAGALYELTESYVGVFAIAGGLFLISALTQAFVHRFEK